MPLLNYRYRLMPTPAQAAVLGDAMRVMGWGWNLMVRRTNGALRAIHLGHAGTIKKRLTQATIEKAFTGQRAAKVNALMAGGILREAAEKAVLREMVVKAQAYNHSRLAMEFGLAQVEAAKKAQMGSAFGSAWSQVARKYRRAWEACWRGKGAVGAPKAKPVRDSTWIQCQVAAVPAETFLEFVDPLGPHRNNWVDLGRFFPDRLTRTPDWIRHGTAKSLRGSKGTLKETEIARLKKERANLSLVRLLQHRPLPSGGIVKDMKVVRSCAGVGAEWHLVLALEVPDHVAAKNYPVTGQACGVNPARRYALSIVGEDMLTTGGGTPGVVGGEDGPGRPLDRVKRKLRRLQRRLERQRRANNPDCFDDAGRLIKGKKARVVSKRMERTLLAIRRLQGRASRQRKEAFHRIVDGLLNRYDTVYLGDWRDESPKNRRARNRADTAVGAHSRAIEKPLMETIGNRMDRDNALGVFRRILAEKVARSGGLKTFVLVPEPYTTQTCAMCNALTGPRGLRIQGWWSCPECEHRQFRVRTAAYNILRGGKRLVMGRHTDQELPTSANKSSLARGKGAGQALKGGILPAEGRMPPSGGEGASASRPAMGNRKVSATVPECTGLTASSGAKSLVTFSRRDMCEGASPTDMSGPSERVAAETAPGVSRAKEGRESFRHSRKPATS